MKAAARRDHRRRRQEAHDPDQAGRQPVRLQPGRAGGRRPDQQRQGRPHDGLRLPGHRQPGRRPVRGPRAARPSPTSSPGSRSSSAAAAPADKPFKWTYAHALGLEQIVANFIAMWDQVTTNKKVGFLFANDADGQAWTDMKTGPPAGRQGGGLRRTSCPISIRCGLEDYTKYISDFKKNGCEICCGTIITPDFTNFWKQSIQQGYNPKVLTIGKALLFPQTPRGHRPHRLQHHGGGRVAPHLAVQGLHHRQDLPGAGRRLHGQDRRGVDRAHRPVRQVRMGGGRLQAGHQPRRQRRHHRQGQDHQARHLPRPHGLHRARRRWAPQAPGRERLHARRSAARSGSRARSSPSSPSWSATLSAPDLPVAAKVQPMQYAS